MLSCLLCTRLVNIRMYDHLKWGILKAIKFGLAESRRLGSRPVLHGSVLSVTIPTCCGLSQASSSPLRCRDSRAFIQPMDPLGLLHWNYSAQPVTHINLSLQFLPGKTSSENAKQTSPPPHCLCWDIRTPILTDLSERTRGYYCWRG